jgi:hypothetical protein
MGVVVWGEMGVVVWGEMGFSLWISKANETKKRKREEMNRK